MIGSVEFFPWSLSLGSTVYLEQHYKIAVFQYIGRIGAKTLIFSLFPLFEIFFQGRGRALLSEKSNGREQPDEDLCSRRLCKR